MGTKRTICTSIHWHVNVNRLYYTADHVNMPHINMFRE